MQKYFFAFQRPVGKSRSPLCLPWCRLCSQPSAQDTSSSLVQLQAEGPQWEFSLGIKGTAHQYQKAGATKTGAKLKLA